MGLETQIGSQLSQMMINPRNQAIKKYMADILMSKYPENAEIIDRLLTVLLTDRDIQLFAHLIGHVYQVAYGQAVEDHREQLEKLGLKTQMKTRKGS